MKTLEVGKIYFFMWGRGEKEYFLLTSIDTSHGIVYSYLNETGEFDMFSYESHMYRIASLPC
jgi:hypothetical protein